MTPTLNQPVCILDLKAALGEGPYWSPQEKALYFVDILGHRLYRYQPEGGALTSWEAPSHPAFILPVRDGSFIIGQQDGLYRFTPETGIFSLMNKVEHKKEETRLNDGCIDLSGRLWFGTMDLQEKRETGTLFCCEQQDKNCSLRQVDEGYTVSNGPAISPDGRILYVADSPRKVIYAFDLDVDGKLSRKRVFVRLKTGYPDGLVTDAQGNLWSGVWGGGCIARFRPDGRELPFINMPVSNVTKLCFGGADYRTVYVTTARNGLSGEALSREPQAGGLFMFRTDIPGWKQPRFLSF